MIRHALVSAVVLGSAFVLTGCTDPIIGSWESKDENACGEKSEFDVDDDLRAEGDIWFEDDVNQVCLKCSFEGDLEDPEDGRYKGEIELDEGCNCEGTTTFDAECTMNDDETEMDCEVDLEGCGKYEDDFEKQE